MRIIAGTARGLALRGPEGRSIRPTGDKIRGAVFNALEARGALADSTVLDVFCGTGALGLEALSRGAKSCTFIDNNREALSLAQANAQSTHLASRSMFLKADATRLQPNTGAPAPLALLDPPYGQGLLPLALAALRIGNWLAPSSLCVAETEAGSGDLWPDGFTLLSEKRYGDTRIVFLRVGSTA